MELTLEVSGCKYPSFDDVDSLWNDNRDSMTNLLYRGFEGVMGVVGDADNWQPLSGVKVSVVGRPEVVFETTDLGEFWRILLPGIYGLRFT